MGIKSFTSWCSQETLGYRPLIEQHYKSYTSQLFSAKALNLFIIFILRQIDACGGCF
jgi:hypothetical protein